MKLKLYYTPRTRAKRVRWLLAELGLSFEQVNVDLFKGEGQTKKYKKIHPLGCVPALEVDGNIIYESGAICDWLTDYYSEKQLAPSFKSELRLKYKQWFYFVVATIEPEAWCIVLHSFILPEKRRVPDIIKISEKKFKAALTVIENELEGKNYLVGDDFTTADIMLVSLLSWLPKLVQPFENTCAYMKRMQERECFVE